MIGLLINGSTFTQIFDKAVDYFFWHEVRYSHFLVVTVSSHIGVHLFV